MGFSKQEYWSGLPFPSTGCSLQAAVYGGHRVGLDLVTEQQQQYLLHGLWLVESADVEPQMWMAHCKVTLDFPACGGLAPLTVQLFEGHM